MSDRPDRLPSPDRERLSFEKPKEGLYVHDRKDLFTVSTGPHEDETTYYLPVQRFMEVQRERDDWKRTASLANALLSQFPHKRGDEIVKEIRDLFDKCSIKEELTEASGRAVLSVVESFRAERQGS